MRTLTDVMFDTFETVEQISQYWKERGFEFVITAKSIEPIDGCDILISATSEQKQEL